MLDKQNSFTARKFQRDPDPLIDPKALWWEPRPSSCNASNMAYRVKLLHWELIGT